MKSLLAALVLVFSTVSFAHEGHDHGGMSHLVFSKGALHAHATWVVAPQTADESILRLEWKNGATHAATEPTGNVKVSLWMPDMGHGSAPTRIQKALDAQGAPIVGAYDVVNMYFTMGGRWQVLVTLTQTDGSSETQTIEVQLSGGGHHH